MPNSERGSILLPVLASMLILTVMLSALLSISARDMMDIKQSARGTNNLADLRSGLQAVYKQLQTQWQTLAPNGTVTDIATAQTDLTQVASLVQGWCNTAFQSSSMTVSLSLADNNFSSGTNALDSPYNVYQNYHIKIVGTIGTLSQTLTDTVTISGAVDSLNYAVYAPGYVMITGAPEIDGRVAAQGNLFLDSVPWEGTVETGHQGDGGQGNGHQDDGKQDEQNSNSTYLTFEGQPIHFWPEPVTPPFQLEPQVLPRISDGISVGGSVYPFTSFTDQGWAGQWGSLLGTNQFGNGDAVDKTKGAIAPAQLSQYVEGLTGVSKSVPALDINYVKSIVDQAGPGILLNAQLLNKHPLRHLPGNGGGGYVQAGGDKGTGTVNVTGSLTLTGPLYVAGNLTIPDGTRLNLTQPLFVTGNLVVNGSLTSSATVYVGGSTTLTNMPPDQPGVPPSRLELFCANDITLTFASKWGGPTASTPTTLHAFLASNLNVYLEGMDSFYKIIGGVSGQNVILNATVGATQLTTWPFVLMSPNLSDHTRRLTIQYDNSYVSNPLPGTPTLGKMSVQALPPPYVTSP